ncbi:MAG: sugar ABC transporter ATP-binding protein [Saprospiraceae bacterium]
MKLALRNISKSFGAVQALQQVSFDLVPGEVHALCGENGAGKSTLMNILSGNIQPDGGEIFLSDQRVFLKDPSTAVHYKIATVYQHLSLFDNLTVAENIYAHHIPTNKKGLIDKKRLILQTEQLLQEVHKGIDANTLVSNLSMGQKQLVEIAKSLAQNPQLLILDEPTSSITDTETKVLFKIIADLKSRNVSIIYITHRLDEIFHISDRVTVLKDGKYVGTMVTSEVNKERLIHSMVGRDIHWPISKFNKKGDIALAVENLQNKYLKNISFELRKGEILALAGLVGAGRTEIAKTIMGVLPLASGKIFIQGVEVTIPSPLQAIRHGLAYVPEDRKGQGLFVEMSIVENIVSSTLTQETIYYNHQKANNTALEFINKFDIKTTDINKKTNLLSGGNQQKVVLSKWLSLKPQIMMIDEPTQGIDIGAKFEIYQLLKDLTQEGKAILLISSELVEILSLSDRILVIKHGHISKELITKETTEAEIMEWAM